MTYTEGAQHMKSLFSKLKNGTSEYFDVGVGMRVSYPGYKKEGDYKFTVNGVAPTHTDVVSEVYQYTNAQNFNSVVDFLNDIYNNGLNTQLSLINTDFKNKIFWITLQEDINFPLASQAGRKLPFQRYYEAALVHTNLISISQVKARTNNHQKFRPQLLSPNVSKLPDFYK